MSHPSYSANNTSGASKASSSAPPQQPSYYYPSQPQPQQPQAFHVAAPSQSYLQPPAPTNQGGAYPTTYSPPQQQQQQPPSPASPPHGKEPSTSSGSVAIPMDASPGDIYALLTEGKDGAPRGSMLPPGWERVTYQGAVVYVDHISREAHEEAPWAVWQRRCGEAK